MSAEPAGARAGMHQFITEAEQLARYLRLASGGKLSLAVVDNQGRTLRTRQGMGWADAHRAADGIADQWEREGKPGG